MKRKAVTLQLEGEIPQPQSAYDLAVEEGYEGSEEQYGKELAAIPPTQEQFDAIPGRLSKLTNTTEKSDFHHITDSSADKVVEFGMEGKTEQETTEGRNWLSEKFSDYESGAYSAMDGTKTDNVNTVRVKELIPASDSNVYAYVESPVEGVKIIARGYGENQEFLYNLGELVSGSTKYIQADTKYIGITLFNDNTTMVLSDWQSAFESGLKLYISSSTKTTYEPYTNGPSPNPDYPQEIVNAGKYNEATGRYEIGCKVFEKNWLNTSELYDFEKYTEITITDTVYYAYPLQLLPNTDYYISAIRGTDRFTFASYVKETNTRKNLVNSDMTTKTGESGILWLVFPTAWYSLTNENIDKLLAYYQNLQIELGKEFTSTQETVTNRFTLTSPVPLTKWDYLTKRDGVWGWSIQAKEYIENSKLTPSTLSVTTVNEKHVQVYFKNIKAKQNSECFCNISPVSITNDKDYSCGFWYGATILMRIKNEFLEQYGYSYGDLTESERWNVVPTAIQAMVDAIGGIQVWTDMQEEQAFHPLPDEEQTLLNNLETYYGVTNLYNDQGCPMWLTYVQDTKTAVDNKFNNIKTALLSLGANI